MDIKSRRNHLELTLCLMTCGHTLTILGMGLYNVVDALVLLFPATALRSDAGAED